MDFAKEQQFEALGFVNLGPIFKKEQLETIGKEYDRLVTPRAQMLGNKEEGEFPYRAMLNFRSAPLAAFINHPAILEVAQRFLGDDIRFWWDQGINKTPGAQSPIDWHQDNGYTHGRTKAFLTFWLALDASDTENGGLIVIPGSQHHGLLPHHYENVHAVVDESRFDVDRAVALDACAGDMLVFSSYLIHRTVGNHTTDRHRRAWVMQYCQADQRNEETGEIYDNRPWVMRGGEIVPEPTSERPFRLHNERP